MLRRTAMLVFALLVITLPLHAQHAPAPVRTVVTPLELRTGDADVGVLRRDGMPAWLKWGVIGGAAAGGLAALLSGMNPGPDAPGPGESALLGFAYGFVIVGGGVAVYQFVCKPGGWSQRNGLCTPAR